MNRRNSGFDCYTSKLLPSRLFPLRRFPSRGHRLFFERDNRLSQLGRQFGEKQPVVANENGRQHRTQAVPQAYALGG